LASDVSGSVFSAGLIRSKQEQRSYTHRGAEFKHLVGVL
jgi:hypothetical protein